MQIIDVVKLQRLLQVHNEVAITVSTFEEMRIVTECTTDTTLLDESHWKDAKEYLTEGLCVCVNSALDDWHYGRHVTFAKDNCHIVHLKDILLDLEL